MSSGDVSICYAIPFYKGQDYLRRALLSIVRQQSPNWQAIVVDDGGLEPGTQKLVESFADPKIRYYKNAENLGLAGNWNRCLSLAEAPLVTLLHSDDELRPNYTDLMLEAEKNYKDAAAFFCAADIIDESSERAFSFPDFVKKLIIPSNKKPLTLAGEDALAALLRGNFIMCPTLCYRRDTILREKFAEDKKFVVDLDYVTRLLLAGDQIVGLPDVAYSYRRHGSNATVQYTENLLRFHEEVAIYNDLSRTAKARGWDKAAAIGKKKRIVLLNLLYCTMRDVCALEPRAARRKVDFIAKNWL